MLDIIILASTGIALAGYSYLTWSQIKNIREIETRLDLIDEKISDLTDAGSRTLNTVYTIEDRVFRTERNLRSLKPLIDIEATKENLAQAKGNADYWNTTAKTFDAVLKAMQKGRK
jgi:Mg2+ and Co2+ transporter CorA